MDKKKQKSGKNIRKPISDEYDYSNLFKTIAEYKKNSNFQNLNNLKPEVVSFLNFKLDKIKNKYEYRKDIIIFFDPNNSISDYHSDRIYSILKNLKKSERKNLQMFLLSYGGDGGSAYLIGKMCRNYDDNFSIVIPRYAKSAGTLLACAAKEIHMGDLSELGPIDPQIKNYGKLMPALGLKSSLEHIIQLYIDKKESIELLSKYISLTIDPLNIGYYERVSESSTQYASKLLEKTFVDDKNRCDSIAKKLVYDYKDHGFVIDKEESAKIFGKEIIKTETPDYDICSDYYSIYEELKELFAMFNCNISLLATSKNIDLDSVQISKKDIKV